jgi:WD40 repeat protein
MTATTVPRKTPIFISYSRKNKLFVRKLNDAIDKEEIEAWVDWEGIPPSADWMTEVSTAIQASDAFVFIMSPDSLKSKVCMDELKLAIQFNKKIIPLLYREPEKNQIISPRLGSANWIYMRPRKEDFKSALSLLLECIHTDLDWVRQHTRLLQRAAEWEQKKRNKSYLLRGTDLSDAEAWMIESTKDMSRSVLPIQAEYINTCRREAMRQQTRLTIGVALVMVLSVFLGLFSITQWRKAEDNAALARDSAATAIANGQIAATQQALAEQNEARAITNEAIAMAQRSAIQAGIYEARPGGLFTSSLLAIESWQRYPSHEAEIILRNNLTRMSALKGQWRQDSKVVNLAVSADGGHFLSATENGEACLWTLTGKKEYCVLHNDMLNDAALSPDGTHLVTAGVDGFVNVWDGKNGSPTQSFEFKSNVWDVAISRNNQWLAAGLANGNLTLIDLESMRIEVTFNLGNKEVYNLAFSPDDHWLALGLSSGQVSLWRVNGGESRPGPKHDGGANKIEFSPDGNWLVSVGPDKTARAANTFFGGTKYVLPHNDWVEDIVFSPDGTWFVTAADDKLLRVFETETGREKFRMEQAGYVSKVRVSPNGKWIAATGFDGRALVWDSVSGTLMRELPLDTIGTALAFTPDSRLLITGSQDGQISLWELSTLDARVGYVDFPDLIHKAKFNPTGEWALFNTDDQNLWIVPTSQFGEIHDGTQGTKLLALETITYQTKISPDSDWIAFTENYSHTANLYNIQTSTLHVLPHDTNVSGIGFSGDGKLFATTQEKGNSAYIWDVESGQLVKELKFDQTAFTLAFNPSDGTLAIGLTGRIALWDVAGEKEIASLSQVGDIKSLSFNRDGRWLATTSSAGGIMVWDMSGGIPTSPVHQFLQGGGITSLDFNTDGTLLASGGANGYAYLWDLAAGEELARLPHNNSVSGVSFSPIDSLLITVSQKVSYLWDVSQLEFIYNEALVETTCGKLQQNFSQNDWEFFFPNEEYRLLCPNLPQG